MKIFLLGMFTMYLGTSIVTLIMGYVTDFVGDFLEMIFKLPFFIIFEGWKYIRTIFRPAAWFLFFHGVNPFCMTFGIVCEKLNDNQLKKFVKLCPKKDQKNIIKVLTRFKGYNIMDIEREDSKND